MTKDQKDAAAVLAEKEAREAAREAWRAAKAKAVAAAVVAAVAVVAWREAEATREVKEAKAAWEVAKEADAEVGCT